VLNNSIVLKILKKKK